VITHDYRATGYYLCLSKEIFELEYPINMELLINKQDCKEMNNKDNNLKWRDVELLVYALFAAFSVGIVSYLFFYDPVSFSFLIAEDHFAEYGTSVSFGLAGITLLILSLAPGPKIRRVVWMLIGITALVIAAEEISWGQRIFNIETPVAFSEHNTQSEASLHNLAVFQFHDDRLHFFVSYLILSYLFFSLMVLALMPRLAKAFTSIGIPLIQIRLFPVFLLAPCFILLKPITKIAKTDELGEFYLGIAVLMWAIDLFLFPIERKRFSTFTSVLTSTGILLLAGIIAAGLTYKHSAGAYATARLNLMASREYYNREMYEQAQAIYTYIYQHPQYLTENTRINHAKMLHATGEDAEATQILIKAATDLEAIVLQKDSNKFRFRQLGVIYMMLAESKLADNYFDKSIEADQKELALNPTPDEKAKLLFSISKTMEARGDITSAINNIEQANKYAQSAALRFHLEIRLKKLVKLQKGSLQVYLHSDRTIISILYL